MKRCTDEHLNFTR